jgi:hypothetical protein
MSAKKLLIFTMALALVLGVTACKRHDVDQPSPRARPAGHGPEGSANPNVITVGRSTPGRLGLPRRFGGTPIVRRTVTSGMQSPAFRSRRVGAETVLSGDGRRREISLTLRAPTSLQHARQH